MSLSGFLSFAIYPISRHEGMAARCVNRPITLCDLYRCQVGERSWRKGLQLSGVCVLLVFICSFAESTHGMSGVDLAAFRSLTNLAITSANPPMIAPDTTPITGPTRVIIMRGEFRSGIEDIIACS